jgi:hypothetical protein
MLAVDTDGAVRRSDCLRSWLQVLGLVQQPADWHHPRVARLADWLGVSDDAGWERLVLCDAVTVCDRDCRDLDLYNNQLTGAIPASLSSLTGLT